MTPDLIPVAAFAIGIAAGITFHGYRIRAERRHTTRAMQMMLEANLTQPRSTVPLTPPNPARSAAGRKGAAVTNERRADSARAHRKRVLEVAEEIRRCLADKNGGAA